MDGAVLSGIVDFSAEQDRGRRLVGAVSRATPVAVTPGKGGWSIRLVQKIGSGVFQGSKAVSNFNALSVIMATGQVGELIHPQWGTMSVYLTELKMQQESREDYIAYSFVFREADESGSIPKLPEQE